MPITAAIESVTEEEPDHHLAIQMVTASQQRLQVNANVRVRRHQNGDPIGCIIIVHRHDPNTTDEALLDLLDSMGISAWFTDKQGSITACTEAACELVLYSKEEQLAQYE